MREIVLDTETTGLDPAAGHRIVEVACLELMHHLQTGRSFRRYINPERDMPGDAERIHGLSEEFLADKPLFAEIAEEFLEFVGAAKLVIHNAGFDMKFLNAELDRIGRAPLPANQAIDTLQLARRRFPGAQVSLDALCRRFEIDNSARSFHGALLDCELLAEVYLELRGGRQPDLALAGDRRETESVAAGQKIQRPPRPHAASEAELAAHEVMLQRIKEPLWRA